MKRNFFIFLMLLNFFSVFARPNDDPEKIPQGKWVFENVVAFEDNIQIPFSVNDLEFEIPTEMDIQKEELTFVDKEGPKKEKSDRAIKGNFLCLYFPVCAEWKIVENRLRLQWTQDIDGSSGGKDTRTIVLTYKLT